MRWLTLSPSSVADAARRLALVPRDRVVEQLRIEDEQAYERSVLRERRGGGGGFVCGGCRRILRRRAGYCPACGFNGAGYPGAR